MFTGKLIMSAFAEEYSARLTLGSSGYWRLLLCASPILSTPTLAFVCLVFEPEHLRRSCWCGANEGVEEDRQQNILWVHNTGNTKDDWEVQQLSLIYWPADVI